MKLGRQALPVRCANIECENAQGEGPFEIVSLGSGTVVGGHYGFRLVLCRPCVVALAGVIERNGS